jgi:uncharacterized protein (TIGR03435 family)
MQFTDDSTLLRQYVEDNSDEAFAQVVSQHVNLVYSVALRQVGNPHHAEEVTQAVFIILAKKAAQMRHDKALSSWLFQATRLTANNFIRSEMRRQHREQEAFMQSTLNETGDEAWRNIAPLLDTAVESLSEKDRRAVVLRFYEGRTLRDVGAALGASESAAEKRVLRAVEKLRSIFTKKGIVLSAAVLTTAISANSVQAAPAALASSTSAIVVAKGATVGGSTLSLANATMKFMAWAKAKFVIGATAALVLVAGTTTVMLEKIAFSEPDPFSKVDKAFWTNFHSGSISNLPQMVVIRPTKRPTEGATGGYGEKMIGINASMETILFDAYSIGTGLVRTEFPSNMPKGNFDYLANLPVGSKKAFQEELKKKFGITARHETRVRDAFLLKVKETNAPGLRISEKYDSALLAHTESGKYFVYHRSMRDLVFYLEQKFDKPIIDQTGLTNNYDMELPWDNINPATEPEQLKQAVSKQLGLELVLSREPIEMLVIERNKW